MKKISDLPPYCSMKEVMGDSEITMEDKERLFIDWVLNAVKGQVVQSTIHYDGEDIDEWAIPISLFPHIRKDVFEAMGLKGE